MAIDTEQKRRAAAGVPMLPVAIKPAGSLDTRDRWAAGWSYYIDPTAGEPDTESLEWDVRSDEMDWSPGSDAFDWSLSANLPEWSVKL